MGFSSGNGGFSGGDGGASGSAILRFDADCDSSLAVGQFVAIAGPAVLGRYQVTDADCSVPAKTPAVGIIVSKGTPTTCVVQYHGQITGILGSLVPQTVYFLGTVGSLGAAPLTGTQRFVQPLGVALSTDAFLLTLEMTLVRRSA